MSTQTDLNEPVGEALVRDTSVEDARWLLGAVLVLGLLVLSAGVVASLLSS